MKSEILDTLILSEFPAKFDDFLVQNLLSIDDNLVILKSRGFRPPDNRPKLILEIVGKVQRTIDVSYLNDLNTGIHPRTLFQYKEGFGLIDHDNAQLHLWETLVAKPEIVAIEKNTSSDFNINNRYLKLASYDNITDTFVIGIGSSGSPVTYAKWWAILKPINKSSSNRQKFGWTNPYLLNLKDYPQTKFHYRDPVLEWLNITDIVRHNGKNYIITPGGQFTVGKTGVQFEFHILSIYDDANKLLNQIEFEFGGGRFTSDKRYFILKPKKKKRLLIYNMETLEVDYNIPLKSEANMGPIPENHGVLADMVDDLLYVYNVTTLNVCKLIN